MKPRLGIFAGGGIGVGIFSQGLPTLGRIVESLAGEFEVTFYSLVPTDRAFRPAGYTVRSPPHWLAAVPVKGLLWSYLVGRFLLDHGARGFDALLSFWGYPMGTVVVALSRLLRRPSVVILMGAELARLPAIDYGQLRRPWSRRLVAYTCRQASTLVTMSRHQLKGLAALGIDRGDVQVIPWGADRRLFSRLSKTPTPTLKIIQVGNLTPVKDQSTLLRAFALIRKQRPAKLRLVGPDFMQGRLQALAAELGVTADVEFTGPVPFASVAEHHHWADLFLMTSLSEGQNGAVTEAVMCGVLAVGTPVGLIDDLGPEAAVIVRASDAADMAEKVLAIAADDAAWRHKVEHAHRWALAHDLDWTVARLAEVLRQAQAVGAN